MDDDDDDSSNDHRGPPDEELERMMTAMRLVEAGDKDTGLAIASVPVTSSRNSNSSASSMVRNNSTTNAGSF